MFELDRIEKYTLIFDKKYCSRQGRPNSGGASDTSHPGDKFIGIWNR